MDHSCPKRAHRVNLDKFHQFKLRGHSVIDYQAGNQTCSRYYANKHFDQVGDDWIRIFRVREQTKSIQQLNPVRDHNS